MHRSLLRRDDRSEAVLWQPSTTCLQAFMVLPVMPRNEASVENIGHNINSRLAELRPTISADGNLLFFICENHPYNTKYNSIRNSQDIWYSQRDSNRRMERSHAYGVPAQHLSLQRGVLDLAGQQPHPDPQCVCGWRLCRQWRKHELPEKERHLEPAPGCISRITKSTTGAGRTAPAWRTTAKRYCCT
jgi:hypothetical protein